MTGTALPTAIDVGPYRYTITTDELALLKAQESAEARLMGTTEHLALTIAVDTRQAAGMMRDTILHELLHTLTQLSGLAADFEHAELTDEQVISRLSPLLLDALRRNPTLVAFILADDK